MPQIGTLPPPAGQSGNDSFSFQTAGATNRGEASSPALLLEGAAARLAPQLTPGDTVMAQILAIRAGMALLLLKGELLTARLALREGSLEPGTIIQAKIAAASSSQVVLHVLNQVPPLETSTAPVEGQILRSLHLPVTPLYTAVLREMVAQGLPLHRELLLKVVHGVRLFLDAGTASLHLRPPLAMAEQTQPQEVIRAVVDLIRRELPATTEAVKALLNTTGRPELGETLRTILKALTTWQEASPRPGDGVSSWPGEKPAAPAELPGRAADVLPWPHSGQAPGESATRPLPSPPATGSSPVSTLYRLLEEFLLDFGQRPGQEPGTWLSDPARMNLAASLRQVIHRFLQKEEGVDRLAQLLAEVETSPQSTGQARAWPAIKTALDHLLQEMTAQQIRSQPQVLPFTTHVLYLHLPVLFGQEIRTAAFEIYVHPDARDKGQSDKGGGPLRVACRLETPHLGKVAVDLDLAGKNVGLTFILENENVCQFCAAQKEELRQRLAAAELNVTRLEFLTGEKKEATLTSSPAELHLSRINLKL